MNEDKIVRRIYLNIYLFAIVSVLFYKVKLYAIADSHVVVNVSETIIDNGVGGDEDEDSENNEETSEVSEEVQEVDVEEEEAVEDLYEELDKLFEDSEDASVEDIDAFL